jgi:hypothetical protein
MVGGIEHELDEVIGGGGAGSSLNNFLNQGYGSTDLYRYLAANTPSYSTTTAASYFSINGGVTSIVSFNQNVPGSTCTGGDFGDFAPPGTGAGQLIQNACNSTGADAAYTAASPEYVMEQAIGWDPVPEPGTLALLGTSLLGFAALRRRRRQ